MYMSVSEIVSYTGKLYVAKKASKCIVLHSNYSVLHNNYSVLHNNYSVLHNNYSVVSTAQQLLSSQCCTVITQYLPAPL